MTDLIQTKLEPKIGDLIQVICAAGEGDDEEIIGTLKGYQNSDCGKYVVIGNENIFADSIKKWEILRNAN